MTPHADVPMDPPDHMLDERVTVERDDAVVKEAGIQPE